jgi:ribosomal protein S17
MAKQKNEEKEKKETLQKPAAAPNNANLTSSRGRIFEGIVAKKFPKRVAIEFERTVRIAKYERFYKKKTRIHARLPDSMASDVNIGDFIQVRECRPLSKIIHFIVIKKLRSGGDKLQ